MPQASVVVVGGGVLGAWIARTLAARSARVTLVEAGEPGCGASCASFAWVNAHNKQPESYFRLNAGGMAAYHRLAAEGTGADWFHAVGNLEVAVDEASSRALDATFKGLLARGYEARRVTYREAVELEPLLGGGSGGDRIADAAYFPAEGWVDVARMIAQLLTDLRANGGEVRTRTRVAGFEQAGGRTAVVLDGGERLAADFVVCAAGTSTEPLLATAGVELPLIAETDLRLRAPGDERYRSLGSLVDTAPLRTPLRRVVHTPQVGMRPTASGRVVIGADGSGSRVPRAEIFGSGPSVLARAATAVPGLADTVVDRVRIGVRPLPADELTAAGFADPATAPGLYAVVTHSGVTLAPHLARLIAAELLDEAQSAELADFRPDRFRG